MFIIEIETLNNKRNILSTLSSDKDLHVQGYKQIRRYRVYGPQNHQKVQFPFAHQQIDQVDDKRILWSTYAEAKLII